MNVATDVLFFLGICIAAGAFSTLAFFGSLVVVKVIWFARQTKHADISRHKARVARGDEPGPVAEVDSPPK
jgi:hypothetical protein